MFESAYHNDDSCHIQKYFYDLFSRNYKTNIFHIAVDVKFWTPRVSSPWNMRSSIHKDNLWKIQLYFHS